LRVGGSWFCGLGLRVGGVGVGDLGLKLWGLGFQDEVPVGVLEAHASRDHTLAGPLWEGCRESRRCSRDTYPESYITKYTSIRRLPVGVLEAALSALHPLVRPESGLDCLICAIIGP